MVGSEDHVYRLYILFVFRIIAAYTAHPFCNVTEKYLVKPQLDVTLMITLSNLIWTQVNYICQFSDLESIVNALNKNFKVEVISGPKPFTHAKIHYIGELIEQFQGKVEIYVSQDLPEGHIYITQIGNNMFADLRDGNFIEIKDAKNSICVKLKSLISKGKKVDLEELEDLLEEN